MKKYSFLFLIASLQPNKHQHNEAIRNKNIAFCS